MSDDEWARRMLLTSRSEPAPRVETDLIQREAPNPGDVTEREQYPLAALLKATAWGPIDPRKPDRRHPAFRTCECGDYRHQHGGPEHRGSCRICRDGKPPPDGADGCQRFRPV